MAILLDMDEIIIEEKKYVSSKQAAKITGYAKDYIGQLCREGRVPARLVGRSWYVLESAIQDHRFGTQEYEEQNNVEPSHKTPVESNLSDWPAPRYEVSHGEDLPPVGRAAKIETESIEVAPTSNSEDKTGVEEDIQESWKAWFEHIASTESANKVNEDLENVSLDQEDILEAKETEEEVSALSETREIDSEVAVPLRVIHNSLLEEIPKRAMRNIDNPVSTPVSKKKHTNRIMRSAQVVGVLIAIISATLAIFGSGYLDTYIASNNQLNYIAGAAFFIR